MKFENVCLGLVLERLRRSVGLKQGDAASAADMAQSTLSRIERGEVAPRFWELTRLLQTYDLEGEACRILKMLLNMKGWGESIAGDVGIDLSPKCWSVLAGDEIRAIAVIAYRACADACVTRTAGVEGE